MMVREIWYFVIASFILIVIGIPYAAIEQPTERTITITPVVCYGDCNKPIVPIEVKYCFQNTCNTKEIAKDSVTFLVPSNVDVEITVYAVKGKYVPYERIIERGVESVTITANLGIREMAVIIASGVDSSGKYISFGRYEIRDDASNAVLSGGNLNRYGRSEPVEVPPDRKYMIIVVATNETGWLNQACGIGMVFITPFAGQIVDSPITLNCQNDVSSTLTPSLTPQKQETKIQITPKTLTPSLTPENNEAITQVTPTINWIGSSLTLASILAIGLILRKKQGL